MATPRDKYHTELLTTIKDCNDRNGAPLSNDKIQYSIHRFNVEEESDTHNVTVNTFYQTPIKPNIQGETENAILTSERINNLDALAETLKGLTINNAENYESDKNDAKGDPASDPKVATHTSDGGKKSYRHHQRKFTTKIIDQPDPPDHHHDD